MRSARLGVSRPLQQLLGCGFVAAKLGHLGKVPPGPWRQLPVAQLLRDPDRRPQILFCLVEAPEVSFGDAARRARIGDLPPRTQLTKDADPAIEPGKCLSAAAEVVQRPSFLHGGVGHAEPVS